MQRVLPQFRYSSRWYGNENTGFHGANTCKKWSYHDLTKHTKTRKTTTAWVFLIFFRFVASPLQLLNVLEKTDWRLWIFRRFHRDSSRWRKLLPTFDPLWCIKNQPGDCTWSDLLLKPFSFRGEMTNVREAPLMTVYTRSPSEIRILDAWEYGCCKICGNHLDMFDEKN